MKDNRVKEFCEMAGMSLDTVFELLQPFMGKEVCEETITLEDIRMAILSYCQYELKQVN